jgi:putative transposase
MTSDPVSYARHRFPAEIISYAVWLYHVFSLSLRDVELILAERGIVVTHESIRHWCLKFGADFARRLRGPGLGTRGISMRCSSASGACCTICGALSIRMASCWISWCKTGGMAPLPSVSSSIWCTACNTSHDAWSQTACAVMALPSEQSCQMSDTGRTGT